MFVRNERPEGKVEIVMVDEWMRGDDGGCGACMGKGVHQTGAGEVAADLVILAICIVLLIFRRKEVFMGKNSIA